MQFSDYIVFVDESGDHGLESIDLQYPVFVLAFCIFRKDHYASHVCPSLAMFKFEHFGHDTAILHEHHIRKQKPPFEFLRDAARRARFMDGLNGLMRTADFTLIACVIDKLRHRERYREPANPYTLAMEIGLERIAMFLDDRGERGRLTHVIAECRGAKEDRDLELEFRRVCDGQNKLGRRLPFELLMVEKKANECGLQLADLVARPIGRHVLDPWQPNRAYEILEPKFRRSPTGRVEGWGLKCFP